jgi:hypothetical protein
MTYPNLSQLKRRRQVARLRLRHLTCREIADALALGGEKVSYVTVARDLQAIEADWRKEAARDLGEHKGRLLAENQELRRVLWSQTTLDAAAISRSLEYEARLLGLYTYTAPAVDVEEQLVEMGLDPAEVLRQVEEILAGNPQ